MKKLFKLFILGLSVVFVGCAPVVVAAEPEKAQEKSSVKQAAKGVALLSIPAVLRRCIEISPTFNFLNLGMFYGAEGYIAAKLFEKEDEAEKNELNIKKFATYFVAGMGTFVVQCGLGAAIAFLRGNSYVFQDYREQFGLKNMAFRSIGIVAGILLTHLVYTQLRDKKQEQEKEAQKS